MLCLSLRDLNFGNFDFLVKKRLNAVSKFLNVFCNDCEFGSFNHSYLSLRLVKFLHYFFAQIKFFIPLYLVI